MFCLFHPTCPLPVLFPYSPSHFRTGQSAHVHTLQFFCVSLNAPCSGPRLKPSFQLIAPSSPTLFAFLNWG